MAKKKAQSTDELGTEKELGKEDLLEESVEDPVSDMSDDDEDEDTDDWNESEETE